MLNKIHQLEMKICINKLRNTEAKLFSGAYEGEKKKFGKWIAAQKAQEREKMPEKKKESRSQKSVLILLFMVSILSSQ